MIDLSSYVRQVHGTYSAIAAKIEKLVVLLNEVKESDKNTIALAQSIEIFLGSLQKSVQFEAKAARTLPKEKRKLFLSTLKIGVDEIKKLRAFITLSKKTPTPQVITQIHALYQEIDKELNKIEAVIKS